MSTVLLRPKGVWINGVELPGVRESSVEFRANHVGLATVVFYVHGYRYEHGEIHLETEPQPQQSAPSGTARGVRFLREDDV